MEVSIFLQDLKAPLLRGGHLATVYLDYTDKTKHKRIFANEKIKPLMDFLFAEHKQTLIVAIK